MRNLVRGVKRKLTTTLLGAGVLTGVYFLAGKAGLALASINPSASAVWPPTGIALAGLVLLGFQAWPAVLIGAFFVNFTTSGSIGTSLAIAAGNTLEALCAAYLLNRFVDGRRAFDTPTGVFKFTALSALLSTSISATIGVTSLIVGKLAPPADAPIIWATWWLGDAVGCLAIAPVLILWNVGADWVRSPARVGEAILLFLSLVIVGFAIFGSLLPEALRSYPLTFICVPIILWAAFRFTQREVAVASILLAAIAIWGTRSGFGPFARDTQVESLLLQQTFIGIVAVIGLAAGAAVTQSARATAALKSAYHDLDRRVHERTLSLQQAEARFRALVESAPDAMVIVNSAGEIILVNSRTESLFGYARNELLGNLVEVLIPETSRMVHPANRERYLAAPHVRRMGVGLELNALRKDGDQFPVEISLSPIHTDEGTLIASAIRDTSERKRQISELEDARQRAEESSRLKSQFLAIMSHELRTPLNAVIGFADVLIMGKHGSLSPRQSDFVHEILNNGEQLLTLINELLDLSKIESGQLELLNDPYEPNALLNHVVRLLKGPAEEKGLTLTTYLDPALPSLLSGDFVRLKQILNNLVDNAIKFTDNGQINISVDKTSDAGWSISVSDTGIGIAKDNLGYLFDEFRQVDGSLKRRHEGAGLGLSIAHKLAVMMGGTIIIESTLGKGSTFRVELPLVPVEKHKAETSQ